MIKYKRKNEWIQKNDNKLASKRIISFFFIWLFLVALIFSLAIDEIGATFARILGAGKCVSGA